MAVRVRPRRMRRDENHRDPRTGPELVPGAMGCIPVWIDGERSFVDNAYAPRGNAARNYRNSSGERNERVVGILLDYLPLGRAEMVTAANILQCELDSIANFISWNFFCVVWNISRVLGPRFSCHPSCVRCGPHRRGTELGRGDLLSGPLRDGYTKMYSRGACIRSKFPYASCTAVLPGLIAKGDRPGSRMGMKS